MLVTRIPNAMFKITLHYYFIQIQLEANKSIKCTTIVCLCVISYVWKSVHFNIQRWNLMQEVIWCQIWLEIV